MRISPCTPALQTIGAATTTSCKRSVDARTCMLWDTGLIQQWPGGAASLRAAVVAERSAVDATFSPGSWAEESCRVVQAEGFSPARQPTSGYVRAL
jgi:hypothetical protein